MADTEKNEPQSGSEPKPSRTPSALEKVLSSAHLTGTHKKEKKKDEVATQTENFNTPGTIWYAIKTSDRDAALKVIKENPEALNARGPVGETPLHLCFLFNTTESKEIGKSMIKEHPKCITAIYENDLYHGETVLHIAIVNKDLTTVKWLVEQNKQLISMRADGGFFQGESACYYGEYPLAFAACTNNIPMVRYLLSQGGDIFAADSSGNNLLHMCVIHSHQRMYSFILEEEKKKVDSEMKAKGLETSDRVPLSKMRNKEGYTPLTLAALRGDKDMFDFIFQQSKENQWTYGPVSCNIYPLEELDTLQPDPPPSEHGKEKEKEHEPFESSLEIIVTHKHLELLMLPRIVDLLHSKWKAYAGKYFMKRCIQTTIYTVVLSMAVVLRSPNFTYTADWHDVLRIICEIFVVLGWLYKGYKELNELYESGWKYFNQAGSAFLENHLSMYYLVFLLIAILCEAGHSNGKYFFVFFCVLFVWTYELTLLLGFRLTGPFVIMLYKMWGHDIARFAAIYSLVLIGHTSAWYVIAAPDGDEVFHDWFVRLKRDFLILFGQISFEEFADEMTVGFAWLSSLLLFFHIIFVFIMLLNVLIGMMGDTFHDIKERSDQEWHLAYAQIIFSIESELPREKLQHCDYWTTVSGKRYLQVQDVSKEYFQEVVEEKESFSEATLALFDKNKDGTIDAAELQAAKESLEERGGTFGVERKERKERKEHEHVAEIEKISHLGPQDKLEGRIE